MDENTVIKVENVSKKFSKSLKRGMLYGACDILKNAVGIEAKSDELRKAEFWAVNNISFELKKGEVLGIIGANGSGKTTLLKILNGIFWPDKGKISIKGKVGALISVGVGFHQNLTGRENIFLNGAILGMGKKEINKKIDEIIEFADIGDFIDSPVKFYSSGMLVRLGFSSAVFIEPEILLIDEVLAVGDVDFKKRAAEKLKELKNKCSTIFISHNLYQVSLICDRLIWLKNGMIKDQGAVEKIIPSYTSDILDIKTDNKEIKIISAHSDFEKINIKVLSNKGNDQKKIEIGSQLRINVELDIKNRIENISSLIRINETDDTVIASAQDRDFIINLKQGKNLIEIIFNEIRLLPNIYKIKLFFYSRYGGNNILIVDLGFIEIINPKGKVSPLKGYYKEKASWRLVDK